MSDDLSRAFASLPEPDDDGFSAAVLARVEQAERRAFLGRVALRAGLVIAAAALAPAGVGLLRELAAVLDTLAPAGVLTAGTSLYFLVGLAAVVASALRAALR